MNVTFLNVGQGDSIILSWIIQEIPRYGIIDCKKSEDENPTISYLIENKVKEIDFIILTHPHSDHFSGIFKLLSFLTKNNIRLNYFYHTAILSPNYIKAVVKGKEYRKEVARLFSLVTQLVEDGIIDVGYMNDTGAEYKISPTWSFKVLSPSQSEQLEFIKNSKYSNVDQDEEFQNENYANLLSTVLAFYTDEVYFLLTSDAIIDTFYRIDKKHKNLFSNRRLLFTQIPHHGSKKNYKSAFFKNKIATNNLPYAIISVGSNSYGHPDSAVVSDLEKVGFEVYTTEGYQKQTTTVQANEELLSLIEVEDIESVGNDIILKIQNNNTVIAVIRNT